MFVVEVLTPWWLESWPRLFGFHLNFSIFNINERGISDVCVWVLFILPGLICEHCLYYFYFWQNFSSKFNISHSWRWLSLCHTKTKRTLYHLYSLCTLHCTSTQCREVLCNVCILYNITEILQPSNLEAATLWAICLHYEILSKI